MAPSAEPNTSSKRPSFTKRHSSSSINRPPLSPHNTDTLSTSASQRQRSSRHVVGHQTRAMGPRVPSFNRNMNKLTKLTPAYEKAPGQGPRRNLSNLTQLTQGQGQDKAGLRKNHSETSLKKNRSSGQLARLTTGRPGSSKGALKAATRPGSGKKRASSGNVNAVEAGAQNPTVRFDLGDEEDDGEHVDGDDGWVDSVGHSASTTRSNTRRNSMINPHNALGNGLRDEDAESDDDPNSTASRASNPYAKSKSSPALSTASTLQSSVPQHQHQQQQPPDADRITSKLLKRNTSFTAAPRVSSVSAGTHSDTTPTSQAGTLVDSTGNKQLVSRFIEQPSTSTTGTPQESNFLPRYAHDRLKTYDENGQRHSPPERAQQNQLHSGAATPIAGPLPSSRTQQKLWLERQSASIEAQQHAQPPIGLLRANRMSSASLPYAATATNGDGRLTPQMRQLVDHSDNEYKRVRMFQNPLADAIKRLQDSGELLQSRAAPGARTAEGRSGQVDGKSSKVSQSQTMPAQRGARNGASEADARRPRVSFQGLKGSKDDGDVAAQKSTEDEDAEREAARLQKAEAREICRRMWDLSLVSNE
ncbi:MAG: hypothetical protein M1828_007565 [Chrysothrix sp. TS-e1954]|nr:MAG: hypothetical protein M1828_007565 [Chrysothrix sp. TS-e1954]